MSMLFRSMMVASIAGLLMVGCGEKPAEAPAPAPAPAAPAVTPAPTAAPAPKADSTPATGGGYEPTPEERVPGITIDAAAPATDAAAPAPAEAAPAAEPAPAAPAAK